MNNVGDTYTFDFEGDEIVIEARRGTSYGKVKIEVDGNEIDTADLYIDGNYPSPHLVYGNLGDGAHTLKLTAVQKTETTTDTSGEVKTVDMGITPKAGDVRAKAFVWDGFDTMIPLAESASVGF